MASCLNPSQDAAPGPKKYLWRTRFETLDQNQILTDHFFLRSVISPCLPFPLVTRIRHEFIVYQGLSVGINLNMRCSACSAYTNEACFQSKFNASSLG